MSAPGRYRAVTEPDGIGVATDVIRPADGEPIPWGDSRVVIIWISADGTVRAMHTWNGKKVALENARAGDLLLAGWPGKRRQDTFLISDRRAALRALRAACR